jgi:phage terminase large subunit
MPAHLIDLLRDIDPVSIAEEADYTLDAWQADLLRSDAKRVLMLCARQTGKSLMCALMAITTAIMTPGALILLVSPSLRQSSELFRTLMGIYRRLSNVPTVVNESVLRLELSNGSRVVALPGEGDRLRSYSGVDLIVVDEAARCGEDLIQSLRPMMATNPEARFVAVSTPKGLNNWWFQVWHGSENWHRVRVAATDCLRISAEFLEEEKRELGEVRFSEEYELAFVEDGAQLIKTEFFNRAITDEVTALHLRTL